MHGLIFALTHDHLHRPSILIAACAGVAAIAAVTMAVCKLVERYARHVDESASQRLTKRLEIGKNLACCGEPKPQAGGKT